jgi:putative hydrolase of the HAD superfamily
MQQQVTKNIIFDLGGVLLNLDYPGLQKGLTELGIRNIPLAHDLAVLARYETGEASTEEFLGELQKIALPGTVNEKLIGVWNSILLDFPLLRVELLQRLKEKYRIFLLSNINELHAEAFEAQFLAAHPDTGFHSLFEKTYYSCRIGLRKPDPQIFNLVLRENGLVPEETVFIDDVLENVRSAETCRIRGLHLDLGQGLTTEHLLKDY